MYWFDICIIVLIAVFVLMVLACTVGFYTLTWRYEKFYETTEEGKKLYKRCSEDLARVNEAMTDWSERIDKIVAALPKKYSGILEYNWANAKVEVKEEERICW